MSFIIRWYSNALRRQPIFTQAWSTGLLFGAGDIIAQHFVEGKRRKWREHDIMRTGRMMAFGTFMAGPAVANWYRFLDRLVKVRKSGIAGTNEARSAIQAKWEGLVTVGNSNIALTIRVAMDQLAFAPCFLALFFIAQGIMEGHSVSHIKEKMKSVYPAALLNNYKLWPWIQIVNFRLVPLQYRLLVVNTVALGWNTYLSLANQQSSEVAKVTTVS